MDQLIYSSLLLQVIHVGTRAALADGGVLGSRRRKKKPNQREGHPQLRLLGWSRAEALGSKAIKSMPECKGSRPRDDTQKGQAQK